MDTTAFITYVEHVTSDLPSNWKTIVKPLTFNDKSFDPCEYEHKSISNTLSSLYKNGTVIERTDPDTLCYPQKISLVDYTLQNNRVIKDSVISIFRNRPNGMWYIEEAKYNTFIDTNDIVWSQMDKDSLNYFMTTKLDEDKEKEPFFVKNYFFV